MLQQNHFPATETVKDAAISNRQLANIPSVPSFQEQSIQQQKEKDDDKDQIKTEGKDEDKEKIKDLKLGP